MDKMNIISRLYPKAYKRLAIKLAESRDIRLKEKYLVIESDDWGSKRMPSESILAELQEAGLKFFTDIGYDKYDTLETDDDVECLLELLDSYRDQYGNHVKLTLNGVVANPDFLAIRESRFEDFKFETIDKSLAQNPNSQNVLKLLKEASHRGLIKMQYHGREHLNVPLWMNLIREGDSEVLAAFDKEVWSMKVNEEKYRHAHVLAAYDIDCASDKEYVYNSFIEGIDIFETIYGFKPLSMIAPNYTWDDGMEEVAAKVGIKYLQGGRIQRHSVYTREKGKETSVRFIGQKNHRGQIYLVRNCIWEPSQNSFLNSDYCLSQINKAFNMGRPAIISAHRLNFIGGIDNQNRTRNLMDLKNLLHQVLEVYPDVHFVSSDELGEIIMKQIK